jgi:glycosyltransferase involved in cell wall biosynthesis
VLKDGERAMKILQVVPFFPPAYAFGGPVKMAYQIARELVRRNHEVTVYTSDAKDLASRMDVSPTSLVDGIRVYYFRNAAMLLVKNSKLFVTPQLFSVAKGEVQNYDVIHLHEYRTFQNFVVAHYARKHAVPYVLQTHGSLPASLGREKLKYIYDRFFGHRLLRDALRVIALTRTEAKQARQIFVPNERISIIPNGIDMSEYASLPRKGSFRKKFGFSQKKILLYLGRINRVKGLDVLVEAYAHLVNEMKCDDVVLVIVGPDDGYLNELRLLIERLGIDGKVAIVGPLYDREKLEGYVDADVYVLPSRYETFPMSLLEAYACGKPVIASKVGDIKDLVINGVTGLLFERGNIGQLADCIQYILNDESRAIEMGLKGKQFVNQNFTIEKVVDELQHVYRSVA